MSRFRELFANKKPFIGYLTAGDGGIEYSVECAKALISGGIDILELGIPFSDPVADGPVIEKAHQRALVEGITPDKVLKIIENIRLFTEVPILIMSYYNPLLQKGKMYLKKLKRAGCDAILTLDLPLLSQQEPFLLNMIEEGLIPIFLVTTTTTEKRLAQIDLFGGSFVYYVVHKGTTGVRETLPSDFSQQMQRLRKSIRLPIVAGFGIADQKSAREVLSLADGFVVGSAFVSLIEKRVAPEALTAFAQSIDPRTTVS